MKSIFFDLDGTLSDPKVGITKSIQYALERLDVPVPTKEKLLWCIGPPLRASFEHLLDEARADKAVALYRERFGDVGLFENDLYDGIPATLDALQNSGIRLFVATSKPHFYARRIVEHFGIAKYFDRVFGSELDGTRVDKSDLLAYALAETCIEAADCAMIGDREHDMIGAVNNALYGVGALYGYGTRKELQSSGALRFVSSPTEIPELFIRS